MYLTRVWIVYRHNMFMKMKTGLVGYTGFVGSNLMEQRQFSDLYRSTNIDSILGLSFDYLVCSGIPASMWLANRDADKDLKQIEGLIEVLRTVKIRQFVLISTIAVYRQPVEGVYEGDESMESVLSYGRNRAFAETRLREYFPDMLVVRLPGIFGDHLKKNFIYDLLNPEPAFFDSSRFEAIMDTLSDVEKKVFGTNYLFDSETSRYVYNRSKDPALIDVLKGHNITSLQFTDSRSMFQYYHLKHLDGNIRQALEAGLTELNVCSEPVSAKEIAAHVTGEEFENIGTEGPLRYDMRTRYGSLFRGSGDYLFSKEIILHEIKDFIEVKRKREEGAWIS